jgi:hypothetical protein
MLSVQYVVRNPVVPTVSTTKDALTVVGKTLPLTGSVANAYRIGWSLVSGPGTANFENENAPNTAVTFTKPGTYILRLIATNDSGVSSRTYTIDAIDPFKHWQGQHWPGTADPSITGESADPDQDGEVNLLEFATGQNPSAKNRALGSIEKKANADFDYIYHRSKMAVEQGYQFDVEWSEDLNGVWNSVGSGTVVADGENQTVTASIPRGLNGKRFVRLKVSAPLP